MIQIRPYQETDAGHVGILIADTYGEYNLDFATPEQKRALLGPFQHARSTDPAHRRAIAEVIPADMVFVAEDEGKIVGVLRGRTDKLQSLFVDGSYHRRGIGRQLVQRFEQECLRQQATVIRIMATLYAVPFYLEMGYKKSTGVRYGRTFEGVGLPYQPMKKILRRP